jgi:hypothetical protein
MAAFGLALGLLFATWVCVALANTTGWPGSVAIAFAIALLTSLPLSRPLLLHEEIRLDQDRLEWIRRLGPFSRGQYTARSEVECFYVELERAAVTAVLTNGHKLYLAESHLFANHQSVAAQLEQHRRWLSQKPAPSPSAGAYR